MTDNPYQQRSKRRRDDSFENRNPGKNWVGDFEPEWIKDGFNKNAVVYTAGFGKFLSENSLTTSQIRNTYGELKRIQMKGFKNEIAAFYLLKPKMAYAVARNGKAGQKKLGEVFNIAFDCVENEKQYNNLMDFMEAILAYHKAEGGR